MLIGFQKLEASLKGLVNNDSISSAYLFFGRKGIGKATFARMLANFLEHNEFKEPNNILRESFIIDKDNIPDDGDASEESSKEIKIDDVRDATNFLRKKPSFSKYRCVIIQDAENLNIKAQNALLKILEDPPEHGIIIATAIGSSSIADTLLSRFECIYIPTANNKKIVDFVKDCGNVDDVKAKEITNRSNGSIGRAIKIINNDKRISVTYTLTKKLFDEKENDASVISEILDELFNEKQKNSLLEEFFEEMLAFSHNKAPSSVNIEKEISKTLFFIRSVRVNKYIHIKNLLWIIRSHLYQLHL